MCNCAMTHRQRVCTEQHQARLFPIISSIFEKHFLRKAEHEQGSRWIIPLLT